MRTLILHYAVMIFYFPTKYLQQAALTGERSLPPESSNSMTPGGSNPGFGVIPTLNTSHSNMPYDHCKENYLYSKIMITTSVFSENIP